VRMGCASIGREQPSRSEDVRCEVNHKHEASVDLAGRQKPPRLDTVRRKDKLGLTRSIQSLYVGGSIAPWLAARTLTSGLSSTPCLFSGIWPTPWCRRLSGRR
jgi:hypothetical protein